MSIYNEQIKLTANFLNAMAIGLIGLGFLRPMIENNGSDPIVFASWALVGLVIHGIARYTLEYLE